jgi:hypothetical protein
MIRSAAREQPLRGLIAVAIACPASMPRGCTGSIRLTAIVKGVYLRLGRPARSGRKALAVAHGDGVGHNPLAPVKAVI